jgi:very-short-patch-repair endonuclease
VGRRPYRPVELRGQAFRGRDAIQAGLLTEQQLRSAAWRRLFQGVYVDSSIAVSHRVRCTVAADFVLPPDGVLAGRSAAEIYGVAHGQASNPVEIVVPRNSVMSPYAGVIVHRTTLIQSECQMVDGLPVTTPVRTCFDLACWHEPIEAVAWIDAMIAARVVNGDELVTYLRRRAAERPRPRGIRMYTRALHLADGHAESPQESRLRASLVLAGLPFPKVQFVVLDERGQFVARVDLAYDEYRIAIEYDGLWHVGSAQQMNEDRRRVSALSALGWTVIQVTSTRLRADLPGIVTEIRAAIRRRSGTPNTQ